MAQNKDSIKQQLRLQLAKAADAYARELHRQWGMETTADDYWIGGSEQPCGAPYQLRTLYFISLDEMQYIIDHDISRDVYDEYTDYCQRLSTVSDALPIPSFRDWHEHPDRRISAEQLEHLQELQDQLDEEIENIIKKQTKGNSF